MFKDRPDDKAVERDSVDLPGHHALPGQQDEEYQHSPVLDRETVRKCAHIRMASSHYAK